MVIIPKTCPDIHVVLAARFAPHDVDGPAGIGYTAVRHLRSSGNLDLFNIEQYLHLAGVSANVHTVDTQCDRRFKTLAVLG